MCYFGTSYCGCLLPKAKLKSNGLIHFVEEISRQPTMTRESYGENVEGEGCRRGGHWLFLGVSKNGEKKRKDVR